MAAIRAAVAFSFMGAVGASRSSMSVDASGGIPARQLRRLGLYVPRHRPAVQALQPFSMPEPPIFGPTLNDEASKLPAFGLDRTPVPTLAMGCEETFVGNMGYTFVEYCKAARGLSKCPDGYDRISSLLSCSSAAQEIPWSLGPLGKASTSSDHPGGCYIQGGHLVFNIEPEGTGDAASSLICTGPAGNFLSPYATRLFTDLGQCIEETDYWAGKKIRDGVCSLFLPKLVGDDKLYLRLATDVTSLAPTCLAAKSVLWGKGARSTFVLVDCSMTHDDTLDLLWTNAASTDSAGRNHLKFCAERGDYQLCVTPRGLGSE